MDSCEHVACQEAANRAAWLASAETFGTVTFTDLSRIEPGLRPFSVNCSLGDATLYMRDEDRPGRRWWMVRVSEVTDPGLIADLETARTADQPVSVATTAPQPVIPE